MTTIYLAYGGGVLYGALDGWDWENDPLNFLVAYPYLKGYWRIAEKHGWKPRKHMLDSGAFSAWRSGYTIDIDALIEECKNPIWDEQVGLDVIGSWEGSLENANYMLAKECHAMPVFHIGDPWELLTEYCERWPKVGLSCRFGEPTNDSYKFYDQCFARAWPHKFHSFGWMGQVLYRYPFHSADASSWQQAPLAYGNSKTYGPMKGASNQLMGKVVRHDLAYYMTMEKRLKHRWAKALKEVT